MFRGKWSGVCARKSGLRRRVRRRRASRDFRRSRFFGTWRGTVSGSGAAVVGKPADRFALFLGSRRVCFVEFDFRANLTRALWSFVRSSGPFVFRCLFLALFFGLFGDRMFPAHFSSWRAKVGSRGEGRNFWGVRFSAGRFWFFFLFEVDFGRNSDGLRVGGWGRIAEDVPAANVRTRDNPLSCGEGNLVLGACQL